MGFAERQYGGGYVGGGMGQPSRLAGCPVTKWLLISNIVIHFLDMLVLQWRFHEVGFFSVHLAVEELQLWRFFTFQFLHDPQGLFHLLVNSLGLFFFGPFVERWWGSKKFTFYYLICGVAGALFYLSLFHLGFFGKDPLGVTDSGRIVMASERAMVGASAGIYGILACVAIIAPNLKVLLFFVIPMSMRMFAYAALGIAVVVIAFNLNNAGGEAGHLGGALCGFLFMKFTFLLNFFSGKGKGSKRTFDARVVRPRRKKETKMRPRVEIDLEDTEIDRILDKVNEEGLQSLTEAERNVLRRVADSD